MALVNPIPEKLPIPHEPGEWLEVRRLSWKQLRAARKKQEAEGREEAKALGAELFGVILNGKDDDVEKAEKKLAERKWRVEAFDRETLLTKGICAWSYDQPLSADAIGDLDEVTAEWAARQILEMSRPTTADQQKNEIASSIDS
jgi:hypothetical protein